MPKKKQPSAKDDATSANGGAPAAGASSSAHSSTPANTATIKSGKAKGSSQQQSAPGLVICRNKHWRYISSFHGPWLQLPPEILETMANINYYTTRPRLMDPAVFFDMVKIRKYVDDATDLAVRAASGVASTNPSSTPQRVLALGLGSTQTKLSRERKYRMREQATQKLCEAYRLDEIASSVAAMQSTSALEEVASHVLQRKAHEPEAKYVHFFHEKIPSRHLAESTDLTALNDIISAKPHEPELLRTRAIVRLFKGDPEGAAADLTDALRKHRLYRPPQTAPKLVLKDPEGLYQTSNRRQDELRVKEENQPNSLETQLLFHRAGAYLLVACQHVRRSLPDRMAPDSHGPNSETSEAGADALASMTVEQAQKLVRLNAKRALRDYTAYLSHFEYSPDLPVSIAQELSNRMGSAMHSIRPSRSHGHSGRPESPAAGGDGTAAGSHRVYPLSELFTATPPADLPPYPSTEVVVRSERLRSPGPPRTTTETLTYHPLLAEALHSLLLCHCLIQTSAKELLRHAYMVARLVRLADGWPIFQASRSQARGDWAEVLRAGDNWIQLAQPWDDLCAPEPLPLMHYDEDGDGPFPASVDEPPPGNKQRKALPPTGSDNSAGPNVALAPTAHARPVGAETETEKQRKERFRRQAVLEALNDDRVADEESFWSAVRARQLRAELNYHEEVQKLVGGKRVLKNAIAELADSGSRGETTASGSGTASPEDSSSVSETYVDDIDGMSKALKRGRRRGNIDDAQRFMTDRAFAIARWVLEAPPNAGVSGLEGGKRRKKRPSKKLGGTSSKASGTDGTEAKGPSEEDSLA